MDFGFNEEQEMLRQSARGLLEKECPSTAVRRLMEDERGYDADLWRKMVEIYAPYERYQTKTPRQIPVVVLTPA